MVDFSKDENIQLDKDGQELTIKVTEVKHTGTYSCEAANEAGTAKLDFDVFVEGQTQSLAHCQISSSVYPEIIWLISLKFTQIKCLNPLVL